MKLNKYILLIGILLMVPNACSGQSKLAWWVGPREVFDNKNLIAKK
jgi:hypothetical protein